MAFNKSMLDRVLGIPSRFLMSEEELAEYYESNGWYRNEGAAG